MKSLSIIIPVFNEAESLPALFNELKNEFGNSSQVQIVFVNDGSTEDGYHSKELKGIAKVIHIDRRNTPEWGGSRPAVRNYGISEATGDFIAFLDDDDLWLPTKLERQISEMKTRNIGFSCTDGYFGFGVYDKNKKYLVYNSERHLKKIKKK